jgi:predicted nucleotidyltransferase component of viral defense system
VIAEWAAKNQLLVQEARFRFAQYTVLRAIADSRSLSASLVFKGGNALDFIWEPNRSTKDLDFSARDNNLQMPDLKKLLGDSLTRVGGLMGVSYRVQHMEQQPPGQDKTFITFMCKVGYALPDDRKNRERILQGGNVSTVVPLDISLNELICATENIDLDGTHSLQVCTLEDIVAEKLRALLQQIPKIPRNRLRCQDVLDIAMILAERELDEARIAEFLVQKASARNVPVSKRAFREDEITDPALNGCNVSDLYASNKAWRESIRGSCLKQR